MEALSDITKNSVSAFAAGSGSAIGATVTLDFGTDGRRDVSTLFTVTGATTAHYIVASPSLDMVSGLSVDELEMDMISVAAVVTAANTVRVTGVVVGDAPITGSRKVHLILV